MTDSKTLRRLEKPPNPKCYTLNPKPQTEAYSAYLSHAWGNLLSEFWEARATYLVNS